MIGFRDTVRLGSPGTESDEEGRVDSTPTWVDVPEARVDEVGVREAALAAQSGQVHDIVVSLTPETDVSDRQVVEVIDPPRLAGVYRIDSIQTTRRHLRVFCTRTTVKDA